MPLPQEAEGSHSDHSLQSDHFAAGAWISRLFIVALFTLPLSSPVTVQPFSVTNDRGTFLHLAFLGPLHFGETFVTFVQSNLKEAFIVHWRSNFPHFTLLTLTVSSTAREELVIRRRRARLRSLISFKILLKLSFSVPGWPTGGGISNRWTG